MPKLFTSQKGFGHCLSKVMDAADLTGSPDLFQITGGPAKAYNLGFLPTTGIPAGANTLKFQFTPTGGTATDLCGATDTASAGAQQLFLTNGAKATGLVKTTDAGILAAGQALSMPIVLSEGVVSAVFSGGPPATGAGMFFIEYEPLGNNTKVKVV
jgi:hypothetical protein